MMNKDFSGIHVPTVTPFNGTGVIDNACVKMLTEFYINSKVKCLVPGANNGEQPHLSEAERKQIWKETIEAAARRVFVFPSITDNTTSAVVANAKYAQSLGADGVMLGAPYYFSLNEEELYHHYGAVADAVEIPIMIHNEPEIFKVDLRPGLVLRLSGLKNIRLIKESTYDTQRIHEIIRLCGEKVTIVVAGAGTSLESLFLGAKAWMTGLINFMPETAVEMYRLAVIEKRYEEAKKIYFDKILVVQTCMKKIGKAVPAVKYALELRGFPVGGARKPLSPLTGPEKDHLRNVLRDIGLIEL